MDSAEIFHIGVPLQHPPISPLSLWERGLPRCLTSNIDLKDRVDYGLIHRVLAIMDSQTLFQVGVNLQSPPISPLYLWERARVRATV